MVDDRMHLWDIAALVPIITEAGGVISDWRGQPVSVAGDPGGFIGDSIA